MRRVWFVRHGESEANAGLPSESADMTALTPKGLDQSSRFAEKFWAKVAVELPYTPLLFVTSRYIRTKQTGAPTFTYFPRVKQEEWAVEEFTYLDTRKYSGTTQLQRTPFVHAWWERGDPYYRDGGTAESFADMLARARKVINDLREREETMTVIFSHGRFMRALLWFTLFEPGEPTREMMQRFRQFDDVVPVPNTCVLPLHFEGRSVPFVGPLSVL